jgi:hypothetical protein
MKKVIPKSNTCKCVERKEATTQTSTHNLLFIIYNSNFKMDLAKIYK